MRKDVSVTQVNHAAGCIQKPWIRIPLIRPGSKSTISLCQTLDGSHSFCARQRRGGAWFVAARRRFTAYYPRQIEGVQCIVKTPAAAVPTEPSAELCHVP